MIRKRLEWAAVAAAAILAAAVFSSQAWAEEGGLVDLLVKNLGVTSDQAMGGAGSIFQVAKQSLGAEDFQSRADVVPDMDSLLGAVPQTGGGTGGALKSVSSMLGGGAGKLAGMAGLTGMFEKLGMDGGMVEQFMPLILEYVKGKGGDGLMTMLKGALSF